MTPTTVYPTMNDCLKAAASPDWFAPLLNLIRSTPSDVLKRLQSEAEAELEKFGFFLQGSQRHFMHIYYSRVRSLCRRELDDFPNRY